MVWILIPAFAFLGSCNNPPAKPKPVEIVQKPEDLNLKVNENINSILDFAAGNDGKVDDSIRLAMEPYVNEWYKNRTTTRTWSDQNHWLSWGDSMFHFVEQCEYYGLFPSDYHFRQLESLRSRFTYDSLAMIDAALWSRADIMLTDGFMKIVRDLKLGRLDRDSVTLNKDTALKAGFYFGLLNKILDGSSLTASMDSLEPRIRGYRELRLALRDFVDTMDRTKYTYLAYPYTDSAAFARQLQTRLFESSYITFNTRPADTAELAYAIRKCQVDKGLKPDGRAGPVLVKVLNNTDPEKQKRIAIKLDRYKQLPDSLPKRYAWANLPAFQLQVWDTDTLNFESRIIIGQPQTRTPLLTSEISNFITFPQWTVPYSIIFKEMLPKIQKNVDFLARENLMVVDRYDSIIDPHTINWKKLNKTNFPYLLKQRQGDDNSLGVIKFNFRNKYSVYMHDTNARGLFSRSSRALSHGCVRVQQWQKLARYLIRNDTTTYHKDTVVAWLKRQEKHVVGFSEKLPLFIRYFTCEASNGHIKFYDDIYGEDKFLREKYFGIK